VAGVGLVVGLAGLVMAGRKKLVPAFASLFNGLVIAVVLALPGWLNIGPLRHHEPIGLPREASAVAPDGSFVPAEWVDAGSSAWQLGDVRITLPSVTVAPVEVTGPDKQKYRTREKYLQITVRVRNDGMARNLELTGWGSMAAAGRPGATMPRLTDSGGKVLALRPYPPGSGPSDGGTTKLPPGRRAEDLLLFEPPAGAFEYLRLELPGSAFGGAEPVRLHVPRSLIGVTRG
jgi:hypothetical protein